MDIKIKVYNGSKYNPQSEKVAEVTYKDIKGFEVKTIEDEEIFGMGFDCVDESKEYLTVTMSDGSVSTFRNSIVDLFVA